MHEYPRGPAPDHANGVPDLPALRDTCHRQAWTITTMSRVIAELRASVTVLKAENSELRVARSHDRTRAARGQGMRDWTETGLPLDVRAPAAARALVSDVLAERVSAVALDDAKLAMSELVSNSVRHSGAPVGQALLVRVGRVDGGFWLEVEDAGHDGFVAPRAPDGQADGGFGLYLVQTLSERWGVERATHGGTRVWAEFSDKDSAGTM